jgi:hypothetical protein
MAEDLPRTKLSEHLEKHVREKLKDKMAEMAKEKAELQVSVNFLPLINSCTISPSNPISFVFLVTVKNF